MLKRFRVPGRLALKLKEHGVSVAAVLRRAGLPGDLFDQVRVLVSTEELFALWHSIEVVSSDSLIGISFERSHSGIASALRSNSGLRPFLCFPNRQAQGAERRSDVFLRTP